MTEYEFLEAENQWNLKKLESALEAEKGDKLTPTAKKYLRGVLCGYTPKEIGEKCQVEKKAVEVTLSREVSPYLKQLLKLGERERINWSRVPHLLAKEGYKLEFLSSHLPTKPQPQEFSSKISKYKDPNFLGREKDIEKLNNLFKQGAKVILIKAEGGIGKTTLAEKWFEIQGLDYLKLNVGTTSQNLNSVEEWVRLKLKDTFKVNPANNFITMLEQLQTKLQEKQIGIFIDNLEPALQNGEFIETHKNYVDLLLMLADKKVNCITIITSREEIYEHKIFSLPTFKKYDLEGLSQEAWQEYFENQGIKIDDNSLNAMWRNYGGNALAMEILPANILQESQGDLKAYWEDNSEDLLRHRSLEQLVQSQFDKLRNDNLQAYNLLCRLGVYPNQNIDLPEVWLSCLLWDIPKNRRKRVIDNLLSRCLVKKRDEVYYLHPVIRVAAIEIFNSFHENFRDNLVFIKNQVDNIIVHQPEIKILLELVNQKLLLLSNEYKKSAFRALYLSYVIDKSENVTTSYSSKRFQYYELAAKLDNNFDILLIGLDNFIEKQAEKIRNRDIVTIHQCYLDSINYLLEEILTDRIFILVLEVIKFLFFVYDYEEIEEIFPAGYKLENVDGNPFILLCRYILPSIMKLEYEQFNNLIEITPDKRLEAFKEYKKIDNIIPQNLEELNIYQCLFYSFENLASILEVKLQPFLGDHKILLDYYDANLVLVYCLNYASPEVLSHIEDTLLLPIEEIEKRPFKN